MTAVVHQRVLDLAPETINAQTTRRMLWASSLWRPTSNSRKVPWCHPTSTRTSSSHTASAASCASRSRIASCYCAPGEVVLIPGGVTHSAEMPEDTVAMDLFSPPRQDWIDKTDRYWRT